MLNSENVQEDGVYLLENGEDGLIYLGNMVNPATLEQIFGVSSLAALPVQASLFTISLTILKLLGLSFLVWLEYNNTEYTLWKLRLYNITMSVIVTWQMNFLQLALDQFDNELSRKVNEIVNEIRRQRCSYLRLRLCRRGEPSG